MNLQFDPQDIASQELRGFIENASSNAVIVDEVSDVEDFFDEFFNLYEADVAGKEIAEVLVSDWKVFTTISAAKKYLPSLVNAERDTFFRKNKVSLQARIREGVENWTRFKEKVKWENRFFSGIPNEDLNNWLRKDYLPKGARMFRARIQRSPDQVYSPKDMGSPPRDKATGGRANPHGIPYLYLSENVKTTLYEVRAVYLDRVSIGIFEILENISIVDFTKEVDLFYEFNGADDSASLADIVKKILTFRAIAEDLSHPMRSTDNSEVEYTPTQVVCEFCKLHGAGGIRFRSSLDKKGVNVVLFNPSKARCNGVIPVEVTQVSLSFEER